MEQNSTHLCVHVSPLSPSFHTLPIPSQFSPLLSSHSIPLSFPPSVPSPLFQAPFRSLPIASLSLHLFLPFLIYFNPCSISSPLASNLLPFLCPSSSPISPISFPLLVGVSTACWRFGSDLAMLTDSSCFFGSTQ